MMEMFAAVHELHPCQELPGAPAVCYYLRRS
jgi:hypothetical protein